MNESPLNWPRNYNPTPQIEGRRPGNLLPQKFSEWPAGRNRASNDAEELLSSAVAWWDASAYRPGDRFLRNLGVGGECLNLRLGSSTVANSNDPTWLKPEVQGYVYLPDSGFTNSISVPDESALDITKDIDIRIRMTMDDWTPSSPRYPFGKYGSAGQRSFYGVIASNGRPQLYWSADGTNIISAAATTAPTVNDGDRLWVRWVLDVDDAGTYKVYFYTAADSENEPTSWTQLGTTIVGASTTSIFSSTASMFIGNADNLSSPLSGCLYRAIVKNGIDGTTVLDIDCNDIESSSQTNFSAKTGQVVQINRSTSGRKSVAMPSRRNGGQPIFLFGTDDYLEVQGNEQHQLLNFGQGDSFTVLVVTRQHNYTASQQMLSKEDNATAGYRLMNQATTTTTLDARVYSNSTLAQAVAGGRTNSRLHVQYVVIGLGARAGFDATASTITASLSMNGTYNTTPLRIGRTGQGAVYCDMEFTAAAIFRRPLSQQEITTITNYYQNRTRFTYTIPSDNDQKTFMASRLGVSSSVAALDILKDAPFYIDSRNFTAGSQYVQNLGWRRDGLNIRLGSSQASDTNDPLYLSSESSGYAYLPGVSGNFLSVPDEASLNITSDIDIRVYSALDDWTPGTEMSLLSKYDASIPVGYRFHISTTGTLLLRWGISGPSNIEQVSSVSLSTTDGSPIWLRVTLDVDNGSGQYEVKFYTSVNGSSWTQLGITRTGATGTTAITTTTQPLRIGSIAGTASMATGKFYRAQVLNGIDGTTVLDINCDVITDGSQTSFLANTGQLVTVNRSTSGRKTVLIPNTTVKQWDQGHLYLPGVSGNYASVPDSAALDITGDIDIRSLVALDDWTPSADMLLLSKFDTNNNRSYQMFISATTGRLCFLWSTSGTIAQTLFTSSVSPAITDGSPLWVRITLQTNVGGQHVITAYTSLDGSTWIQLGTADTRAGTTSIFSSTAVVTAGIRSDGTTAPVMGRLYRTQILNGVNGTTVLDIDFNDANSSFVAGSPSSFVCSTGQTVTLNSTANSGMVVRDARFAAGRPIFLLGTDDYFEIEGDIQHDLLNFDSGDSFTVLSVARQWATQGPVSLVSKGNQDVLPMTGWDTTLNGQTANVLLGDGIIRQYRASNSMVLYGLGCVIITKIDKSTSTATVTVNNNSISSVFTATGSYKNTLSIRIGRSASGSPYYFNGELTATAIFRRALSDAEISTLTSFFTA